MNPRVNLRNLTGLQGFQFGEVAHATLNNRSAMINTYNTYIEVPPFDLKTILVFNAALWMLVGIGAALIF